MNVRLIRFIAGFVLFVCIHKEGFSQSLTINGFVKDESGVPISNVNVIVKNGRNLGETDEEGRFLVPLSSATMLLQFVHVGYGTEEKQVSTGDTVYITLHSTNKDGNEVIVTALGIKRESRSIGYSAQKVNGSDITKASAPDIATGLMGKAAGLNISTSNGVQGNSQRIVIRGNSMITGSNQPLIVIDGIQVTNDAIGGQQQSTRNANGTDNTSVVSPKDWGSYLNFLNSDDVQDITVLKGANAAALYGARGANGVLLITTKKGANRPGLGVDYNISMLFSNPYRYQDVQNSYGYGAANALWSATPQFGTTSDGQLRYPGTYPWDGTPAGDAYEIAGNIPCGYSSWDIFSWYGPAVSWGHKLDGTEIVWWDGVKRKWDPQPDNRKAFFRTGNTTTHNVSINKSGDFGSLRFAYTRLDNTAIIKNSNYHQNSFNLGSSLNVTKILKADITASYNNYFRLNVPDIAGDAGWTNFMIYSMPRDYKPLEFSEYKNADGSKKDFIGDSPFGYYPYQNNYNQNLFWHLFEQNQRLYRNQFLGSVKLSADVAPWLNIAGRSSINYAVANIESKYSPIDAQGVQGQYGIEYTKNQDVNLESFATAHKSNIFNSKFSGSFMVGTSSLKSRYYDNSAWNSGENGATYGQSSTYPWTTPYKYYLANTTNANGIQAPVEQWNDYNLNSLYGILDVSYDNYLFLQVSGRNDWSSTLPEKTSSYFYPAASLSFVFTDAISAFKNLSWLSYGKLKTSFAKSANGALPYQAIYTYSSSVISNYLNGNTPSSFGGVPVRGYKSVLPPGGFLVPQSNRSYEFGLEAGLFNNRINFELTYYQTRSKNQILASSVATSSGASSVTFNTGDLSNKGFEFIVRASAIKSQKFSWDITINGAHNQNKVLSLADGIDRYPLQDLWGTNGVQMYVKAGDNYGSIYGYDYTYINGKKVVQKVLDKNDATKVVGTQYVTTEDPVVIGNATPKLTGGISNNFRYKNWSLYVLTDFKVGGQIYSADYSAAMGEGLAPETLKERDGGGLPYTFPDGTTANAGVILDGVYADGTANTDVVHYMYKYAGQYAAWSNVKMPRSNAIFTNSWGKLREVNLTYSVPSEIVRKAKFIQALDLSLIGRNLFYIFTTLPDHLNPEAINGIGNAQGIQWSQFPGTRELGFSVKVKF
ncbi:SusC/RagA family TonB-linked outer membrane protein [Rhizosphaericola mali]|uniref:SusC/RagA family TonB-linked outer membrane protein n=1 Tax=Rhizosphaericola mali TaxID=2545455 RepID=A0A5P2G188_9BACT|nr:SusC/RagA family TonB-linked outer membrane protein [Rhizosphaericola mali]QES89564.1 SusC/RagA family TonB-linked outer membrane protein [Rhizosphaericola mali]